MSRRRNATARSDRFRRWPDLAAAPSDSLYDRLISTALQRAVNAEGNAERVSHLPGVQAGQLQQAETAYATMRKYVREAQQKQRANTAT